MPELKYWTAATGVCVFQCVNNNMYVKRHLDHILMTRWVDGGGEGDGPFLPLIFLTFFPLQPQKLTVILPNLRLNPEP